MFLLTPLLLAVQLCQCQWIIFIQQATVEQPLSSTQRALTPRMISVL
jgi:hypothetical protein